ncbi:MAG: hypothetical protein ACR2JC_06150 [Chloroflexota bacterium]|nr:MAG: hypothetical protein DLM70_14520 [Chloroflexota bacterium]
MLFGAIIVAEGGAVEIGTPCIIMENAVIRGSRRHPTHLGDHVLVGPRAYLTGCSVFVATGATIFNGARLGTRAEIRMNDVVHLKKSCVEAGLWQGTDAHSGHEGRDPRAAPPTIHESWRERMPSAHGCRTCGNEA